jgi:4-hydroxybenzoate polyprenyltransferase
MAIIKRARTKGARVASSSGAAPETREDPGGRPDEAPEAPEDAGDSLTPATSTPTGPQRRAPRKSVVAGSWPVLLLRTAHPRQALLTAVGLAVAAALSGRSVPEVGLVLATALVGQAILGWHNDLVDRARDRRHDPAGKPIGGGLLDPGTAWFALICGVLLVVPLSISNGVTAGSAYLIALVVGLLGNVVLRRGLLSWLPWAVSYALYPAFLSYGGLGGDAAGSPPEISITVLAVLLGVGVHFLRALPGLVADHEDGWRSLPLRVALKTGATRLLIISLAWTALCLAGLLVTGSLVGLSQ